MLPCMGWQSLPVDQQARRRNWLDDGAADPMRIRSGILQGPYSSKSMYKQFEPIGLFVEVLGARGLFSAGQISSQWRKKDRFPTFSPVLCLPVPGPALEKGPKPQQMFHPGRSGWGIFCGAPEGAQFPSGSGAHQLLPPRLMTKLPPPAAAAGAGRLPQIKGRPPHSPPKN